MNKLISIVCMTAGLLAAACKGEVTLGDERVGTFSPGPLLAGPSEGSTSGGNACLPSDAAPTESVQVALNPVTPPSAIVPAGQDAWTVFSRYTMTNGTDKDQIISTAQISQRNPNADAADCAEVALAADGKVRLWGSEILETTHQYFNLTPVSEQELIIPAKSSAVVEVWCKVADVLPGSVVGGDWYGVARSGHTPVFHLVQYQLKGESPCIAWPTSAGEPNPMVIRKSLPIVTKLPLATTVLANTDQDLLRWQVSAHQAGPVSWIQMRFKVMKDPGTALSSFRLRKDGVELPSGSYTINTMDPGSDVVDNNKLPDWLPVGYVAVVLEKEEVITGSGSLYTLHANVSGALDDSFVYIEAITDDVVTTGYLQSVTFGTYALADGRDLVTAYSVFSDLSEVPHAAVIEYYGGSRDWFSGALIPGMALLNQTLTP